MIEKIISGGQTGADQAALDAAIKLGVSHGGWIPKGRITEEGVLPHKYKLKQMPTDSYPKRTEQNVLESVMGKYLKSRLDQLSETGEDVEEAAVILREI